MRTKREHNARDVPKTTTSKTANKNCMPKALMQAVMTEGLDTSRRQNEEEG